MIREDRTFSWALAALHLLFSLKELTKSCIGHSMLYFHRFKDTVSTILVQVAKKDSNGR